MSSDQSSVFFIYISVGGHQVQSYVESKIAARPHIVLNCLIVADMAKTRITPHAKYPDQTQQFIKDVHDALDEFEEHVRCPDEEVRENAYRVLLEAYHTALTPIWNLAWFADIEMVLKTVADKQMTKLTIMSKKLAPPPNTSQVSKEARKVPDLETFTKALKDKHPAALLPSVEICAQIRDIFSKLAATHKAYAEAADGLAELSTELTPPHYTMILTAVVMPTIQVVIPENLVFPVTASPPPPAAVSTALGKSEIIKYMKLKVLQDLDSPELMVADKNSATHILVVAIYLKVEHLFFDDTSSRMDIATAFRCNLSQLKKAVTGVNYKGGPHYYKPKPKTATKRSCNSIDPNPDPRKKVKPKQGQASTSKQMSTSVTKKPSPVVTEDTLSSSSSSSDVQLPLGLLK